MVRRAPPVIGRWLGELFTYFKFFKGGLRGLGCRLGRRWTVATGDHRPPLYPPTGEGNEGEKIFFLVIGTFKGCPLSHDFVVTASRPATGRKKRGFASTKLDSCPPPAPSHAYTFLRRGLRWRGRGRIFYISHFKGGVAPFGTPVRACLTPVLFFFFGLLKGWTRLPLWGRYVPVARCPAADRAGRRDGVIAER